jgi:hypothetical protein
MEITPMDIDSINSIAISAIPINTYQDETLPQVFLFDIYDEISISSEDSSLASIEDAC